MSIQVESMSNTTSMVTTPVHVSAVGNMAGVGVHYGWCKVTRFILENEILHMKVRDMAHYYHAFVHKSALKELPAGTCSYERLEFIGDSVLNFVVAKYLFDKYNTKAEGYLTKVRTKLVSGKCLSDFSQKLGLQKYIIMNQKALRSGWNNNTRIMEDVFESLIGAIYLDSGTLAAKTFIIATIERFTDFDEIVKESNAKDALMRATQAWGVALPVYHIVPSTLKQTFCIHVYVNGMMYGHSVHKNKREGEQLAANMALRNLGIDISTMSIDSDVRTG